MLRWVCLVSLVSIGLTGCTSQEKPSIKLPASNLVGVWKGEEKALNAELNFEFTKEGKLTITTQVPGSNPGSITYHYSVSGDILTWEPLANPQGMPEGKKFRYKLDWKGENELWLTNLSQQESAFSKTIVIRRAK
jgi:uncharacterized protein (TIGR03066 family)